MLGIRRLWARSGKGGASGVSGPRWARRLARRAGGAVLITATLWGAAACKREEPEEPEEAAERTAALFPGVPLQVCEEVVQNCAEVCAPAYPDQSIICSLERSDQRSEAQEQCILCAEGQLEGDGVTFTGAMTTDMVVTGTGELTTDAGGYGSDDTAAGAGTGDDGAAGEMMSTGMGVDAEGNVTVTDGSQKDPPNR